MKRCYGIGDRETDDIPIVLENARSDLSDRDAADLRRDHYGRIARRQPAHARQHTVTVNGKYDLFRSVLRPLRIQRLRFRHLVRERHPFDESSLGIPAVERVPFPRRYRRYIYDRYGHVPHGRPAVRIELHRIFLRGLRIRIFGLFVISIHAHIFRQRLIRIRRFRQLILPCAAIEKPPLKRMVIFVRRGRQYQGFVPRRFNGIDHASVRIKSNRIFRRKGCIVLNIIRIGIDVFRQCPVRKGVLCQLVAPYVFIQIPSVKCKPLFLRRGGQCDLFIARGLYRIDEHIVIIKRNRICLRIICPCSASGKNTDRQNKTRHDA